MEDLEIIKEFVIESTENLERLDRDMVSLEERPQDADLLANVFRTIHTIKGTCGFLSFKTLEKITHHAENLLSQIRNGERELTPGLVSIILETVDAVKTELSSIEKTSAESGATYQDLIARQVQAAGHEPEMDADEEPALASEEPQTPGEIVAPTPSWTDSPLPVDGMIVLTQALDDADAAKAGAPQAAAPLAPAKASGVADSSIRVDVALLNKLMNLVGELVLARNQILQFTAQQDDVSLNATSQRLNLITTELQEGVMKTRMQPIGMVWSKLPRLVRDLATACGKQIALEMDGADTELDKTIIEAIKDPLTHIVRNSCDHGIERPDLRLKQQKPVQGKLTLRAFHEGGNVNIEVSDDGAGIDPATVKASALRKFHSLWPSFRGSSSLLTASSLSFPR